MPWYYAGPEAKPVGPVTLEELQALRARGAIAPETYVIEEKGQGMAGLAWKRYQELFPNAASLPPLPPLPGLPQLQQVPYVAPPVPPVTPPPMMQAHPLFPSAAPTSYPSAVSAHQPPVFTPAGRPDSYPYAKPTNGWCAWGFGLGLAAFCFSFPVRHRAVPGALGDSALHRGAHSIGQSIASRPDIGWRSGAWSCRA